eukprot:12022878-Alexandrium_andersonii.AAC.2
MLRPVQLRPGPLPLRARARRGEWPMHVRILSTPSDLPVPDITSGRSDGEAVSYTHLRAHETSAHL